MKRLAMVSMLVVMAGSAFAQSISVKEPWSRATPAGAKVGAGYMMIENKGQSADRLVGGSVHVAGRIEIHEMTNEGGVMKMRELTKGLEIKPGETAMLKPGGFHIMFMELKQPLKEGDTINGTLRFEKAGELPVTYTVKGMGGHKGH